MNPELRRLRRALDTMPALERQVFEQVRFGGIDFASIAADLDMSVAEVERRLACAILHLMRFPSDHREH
ncbi:sigma factor-like helix-turn-helix DNA-binding protein [Sphingomonas sp. CJ20]